MAYEITIQKFSGPLEALLDLIESKKLQVSEISLAEVTDDFLKYIAKRELIDFATLADFISVASKLILIKSKSLLPDMTLSGEEEAEIKDLERRLKLYQELKQAGRLIQDRWKSGEHSFARPYFMHMTDVAAIFYPGTTLSLSAVELSANKIFEAFEKLAMETETIKGKVISLEEKISEVIARMKQVGESSFKNLSGEKSISERIVLFLAILHLAREQLISLEQTANFSDIIIKHQKPPTPANS
jgi:segregation and condensation protein A